MIYKIDKKYKSIFLNIIVFFSCLLASVIILFFNDYNGYELLFTQPFIFAIVFLFILSKTILNKNMRIFFIVFIGIASIRYVLLPVLIVVTGYYGGRSIIEPKSISFFKAILLMNYELIVCSFFIAYMEYRTNKKKEIMKYNNKFFMRFNGTDIGYILFGMLTLCGVLIYPSVLKSINFIFPSSVSYSIKHSFNENLVIYFVIVSKQLLFIMLTKNTYNKFLKQKREIYIFLNFLISMFNIFIYFGANRTDVLISAIVSFLLMYKLYGKAICKYIVIGSIVLIVMIYTITTAREYVSISGGTDSLLDVTDTFQAYTGGPYNVAIAIETKEYFPEANDISVLFFDIFRPMIGINVLIKDLPFQYSNIFFNKRMWLNVDRRSQILPMIGQGNLFFGFILAPSFSILFIRLYYYFQNKLSTTNNLEIFYFINLVVVRLGFFMGQNTMNIINDMSMNLVLFLVVYYLNKYIKRFFRALVIYN